MKTKGLTLVELMLSCTLIVILVGMGLAMFDNVYSQERAKNAAEQIAFSLKKAKYYAKTQGVNTGFSAALNGSIYTISANGENITQDTNFDATSGVLPERTKIVANTCGDLFFTVDGSIIDSSDQPITSDCQIKVSSDESSNTVTIQAATGNVVYD